MKSFELPNLRELLGDDGALLLTEKCGGVRICVPQYFSGEHELRGTLGDKVFVDLVRYFGGSRVLVPVAREWRAEIYAARQPRPTQAEIARMLGCC